MRKLLSILVVLFCCGYACAEDVFLSPWQETPSDPRWQGGAQTYQTWEGWFGLQPFGTGQLMQFPHVVTNPFGTPRLIYTQAQQATAPGWPPAPNEPPPTINTVHIGDYDVPSDPIGGWVDIIIPNDPTQRLEKVMQIQITSDKGFTGAPEISPAGSWSVGGIAGKAGSEWYTYESLITIRPNPASETIRYFFPDSTDISEIVVKTICTGVPEPGSAVLLLCGALVAAVWYWKRRR